MDMNQILDTLQGARVAAPSDQKAFDPTAPYEFLTAKDQLGLPQEHASYAKRSCKQCYGRGYETRLKSLFGSTIMGTLYKRERTTCYCVQRGYARVRNQYNTLVALVMAEQGLAEDKAREYVYGYIFGDA